MAYLLLNICAKKAIAGRVGTGNIAGVATGICFGGPGALFWMWMVAIFGAATTFIECTMSQLYKEVVDGEYRGNAAYILIALIILVMNITQIPAAIALIVKCAFAPGSVFGGALGSAVIWGTKRAVYSSETGMSTATPSAGSAEVSHPVKQGLVQAFSVYIDTLFVCTATGIIMILTNTFNCVDGAGNFLIESEALAGNASPGAPWVQAAVGGIFSWGPAFISIALVFFAFTTCMNQMYNCESTLTYFFKGSTPKWAVLALRILFLAFVVYAGIIDGSTAWDFGDVGIGLITWCNMIFLFTCLPRAKALLKDYEEQKKARKDPTFDPDKFNWPGTETWKGIRDKYVSGILK